MTLVSSDEVTTLVRSDEVTIMVRSDEVTTMVWSDAVTTTRRTNERTSYAGERVSEFQRYCDDSSAVAERNAMRYSGMEVIDSGGHRPLLPIAGVELYGMTPL